MRRRGKTSRAHVRDRPRLASRHHQHRVERGAAPRPHTAPADARANTPRPAPVRRVFERESAGAVVRDRIAKFANRDDFRVVEFNVLGNHLHFVVEATGRKALARGMQGLAVRLARAINKLLGRTGKLFKERYHARVLRKPLQVRNVLRYVLLNARHHAAERGQRLYRDWVDPFSSAPWFDGWKAPIRSQHDWLVRLRKQPRPTAQPRSWLLRVGWRNHGLLGFDEVPGTGH